MDFVERKWNLLMAQMKEMTIKRAMMIYVAIGLAASFCCCIFAVRFLENWKYMVIAIEESEKINAILGYISLAELLVVMVIIATIVFLICHLFYEHRMAAAVDLIEREISFLNREDLSFDCSYEGNDEMARVCQSLNEMRRQLAENKRNTVERIEDQRTINAAFAHDIRTPLTIMKGYIQMMEKFYPTGHMSQEKVIEHIEIISRQIERIEQFAQTMKDMNRMEEWEIVYKKTTVTELMAMLSKNIRGIAEGQKIEVGIETGEIQQTEFFCDHAVIQEVADNLVINAMRYAEKRIQVILEVSDSQLFLYVQDDGPGFSADSLEKGSRPYFSTEKEHMGMGLSICRMLCKKHRGDLELTNSIYKGGIACAFFIVSAL